MTNKLLTLEEIEKIETSINQQNYSDDDVFDLAATARAYWEMKKKEVHVNCGQCGMSTFVDIEDTNNNKLDDKPHSATLKVIVEAMKEILKSTDLGYATVDYDDLAVITESLEKHLE